jgi:putative FmdB family regulatory protein
MPLYEYACEACGHRFETIQKFSDPPPDACPKCGGRVRKLVAAPAFQFKGSGWYITDYARKGTRDTKDTDTKDAKEVKDTATTDTKEAKDTKETKEKKAASETNPSKDAKSTGDSS